MHIFASIIYQMTFTEVAFSHTCTDVHTHTSDILQNVWTTHTLFDDRMSNVCIIPSSQVTMTVPQTCKVLLGAVCTEVTQHHTTNSNHEWFAFSASENIHNCLNTVLCPVTSVGWEFWSISLSAKNGYKMNEQSLWSRWVSPVLKLAHFSAYLLPDMDGLISYSLGKKPPPNFKPLSLA